MRCVRCDVTLADTAANYCSFCGARVRSKPDAPAYVGESINKGIYRITYDPVEAVFSHADAARDAASDSCWESFKIEKVASLVLISEYPFICRECEKIVSRTRQGRCDGCGELNWKRRVS